MKSHLIANSRPRSPPDWWPVLSHSRVPAVQSRVRGTLMRVLGLSPQRRGSAPALISTGTVCRGGRAGPQRSSLRHSGPTGHSGCQARGHVGTQPGTLLPGERDNGGSVGAFLIPSDSPHSGSDCSKEGSPLPLSGSSRKRMSATYPSSRVPGEAFSPILFNPVHPKYYHFNTYSMSPLLMK